MTKRKEDKGKGRQLPSPPQRSCRSIYGESLMNLVLHLQDGEVKTTTTSPQDIDAWVANTNSATPTMRDVDNVKTSGEKPQHSDAEFSDSQYMVPPEAGRSDWYIRHSSPVPSLHNSQGSEEDPFPDGVAWAGPGMRRPDSTISPFDRSKKPASIVPPSPVEQQQPDRAMSAGSGISGISPTRATSVVLELTRPPLSPRRRESVKTQLRGFAWGSHSGNADFFRRRSEMWKAHQEEREERKRNQPRKRDSAMSAVRRVSSMVAYPFKLLRKSRSSIASVSPRSSAGDKTTPPTSVSTAGEVLPKESEPLSGAVNVAA